jgi:hypothetical protein
VSRQDHGPDLSLPVAGGTVTLASDDDRDAGARVLNEAFAQGRLTADEHGERVRAAYAARTWHELARLTADLPGPADAAGLTVAGRPDGLDRCLLYFLEHVRADTARLARIQRALDATVWPHLFGGCHLPEIGD